MAKNIGLIIGVLVSVIVIIKDFNQSPNVRDWFFFLLIELFLQMLIANNKKC